jgi:hypothetical protein
MKPKTRMKLIAAASASGTAVAGLLFAAVLPAASASADLAWTTVRVCVSPWDPAGTFVKVQFSGYDRDGNWVVTPELGATTTVDGACIPVEQFQWQVKQNLRIMYHIGDKSLDIPCYLNDYSNQATCPLDYGDHP